MRVWDHIPITWTKSLRAWIGWFELNWTRTNWVKYKLGWFESSCLTNWLGPMNIATCMGWHHQLRNYCKPASLGRSYGLMFFWMRFFFFFVQMVGVQMRREKKGVMDMGVEDFAQSMILGWTQLRLTRKWIVRIVPSKNSSSGWHSDYPARPLYT